MSDLTLDRTETWTPHPAAAPLCHTEGDKLVVISNGTRTCVGGWQIWYSGAAPGRTYRVEVECEHDELIDSRDMLRCMAYWGDAPNDTARTGYLPQTNLRPVYEAPHRTLFVLETTAPPDADIFSLRMTLRWTTMGEARWLPARITAVEPAIGPESHRVAVVTGRAQSRRGTWTVARNVEFYAELCDQACRAESDLDLLLLPEIALQWQVEGHAIDTAVPMDGPEVEPFRQLARAHGVRIGLGLFEREDDAVRNTCLLIAPDGEPDGWYWKVHLAAGGEDVSGILPGDEFPVFETEMGRIGCNICMDSSAAESSRMVGLNGAEWLLLPIMGDHRADRWSAGNPIYSESRWLAIMRTRAMDNQLTMVVARNTTVGSCVIDRKGDVLAWNEGDRDHVVASVLRNDGYLTWNGGCFRDVNWMQRRPHVYGAFVDPDCFGALDPLTDSAYASET